jgi:hypothetical protein
MAVHMLEQISRLTPRWHLNFSPVELTVLRRALERTAVSTPREETNG